MVKNKKGLKRCERLKDDDDGIFKQAYLELKASCEYVKEKFTGFPIYRQFKQELEKYTPRFEQLSNTCQCNSC